MRARLRAAAGRPAVTDTIALGVVTLLVLGYLLYAMLAPEKF